jgi:hypothetical protein
VDGSETGVFPNILAALTLRGDFDLLEKNA